MYLTHYVEFGIRGVSAAVIVLALGSVFEYGHDLSLAGLLYLLLGA